MQCTATNNLQSGHVTIGRIMVYLLMAAALSSAPATAHSHLELATMTHSSAPKLPLAKRFDLFFILTLLFEVAMIILFSLCVTYGTDDLPGTNQTNVNRYWPFYTDVTVMIFVGFGFLMTVSFSSLPT